MKVRHFSVVNVVLLLTITSYVNSSWGQVAGTDQFYEDWSTGYAYYGIGRYNPVRKFHVQDGNYYQARFESDGTNTSGGIELAGKNASTIFSLQADGAGTSYLPGSFCVFDQKANKERLVIDANGKIGIGTKTPGKLLTLSVAGGTSPEIRLQEGSNYWDLKHNGTSGDFEFNYGGTNVLYVERPANGGNIGVGIAAPTEKLHVLGNLKVEQNTNQYGVVSNYAHTTLGNSLEIRSYGLSAYEPIVLSQKLGSGSPRDVFIINASGNVGIGTSSPSAKLHVNGDIKGLIINATGLSVSGTANVALNTSGKVGVGTGTPTEKLHVLGNIKVEQSSSQYGVLSNFTHSQCGNSLMIRSYGATAYEPIILNQQIGAADRNVLVVDASGEVGIGLNEPSEKLHVQGNIKADNGTRYTLISNSTTSSDFTACNPQDVVYPSFKFIQRSSTAYSTRMLIDPNGNVGVGTTAPKSKMDIEGSLAVGATYSGSTAAPTNGLLVEGSVCIGTPAPKDGALLSVEGKIAAKEVVVVADNWADYVFEPGYKLKPLDQVEEYVTKNRHLEGIPTQKAVEKDGVNMGQTQAKMLEKIEELTLYVINLDKENKALKNRVAQLEKGMKAE